LDFRVEREGGFHARLLHTGLLSFISGAEIQSQTAYGFYLGRAQCRWARGGHQSGQQTGKITRVSLGAVHGPGTDCMGNLILRSCCFGICASKRARAEADSKENATPIMQLYLRLLELLIQTRKNTENVDAAIILVRCECRVRYETPKCGPREKKSTKWYVMKIKSENVVMTTHPVEYQSIGHFPNRPHPFSQSATVA
jgi:hypothetical protein